MRTKGAATTSLTIHHTLNWFRMLPSIMISHTTQQQARVHNFDLGDPNSDQADVPDPYEDPDHFTFYLEDGLTYSVYMTTAQSNQIATKIFLLKSLWDQFSLDDKKLIIGYNKKIPSATKPTNMKHLPHKPKKGFYASSRGTFQPPSNKPLGVLKKLQTLMNQPSFSWSTSPYPMEMMMLLTLTRSCHQLRIIQHTHHC